MNRLCVRNPTYRMLQIGHKLENGNDATIFQNEVIVEFCDVVLFLLSSLVTSPSFMSISSLVQELWAMYPWLKRNLEIGNTSVWVLSNIWRLGRVRNTKFGTNVSNKMLLNAAKCQGYSFFFVSELLRENKQGGRGR